MFFSRNYKEIISVPKSVLEVAEFFDLKPSVFGVFKPFMRKVFFKKGCFYS